MEKYITAVDFGTTKVSVAVGENSSVGVRIMAYAEAPAKGILRGDVLNIKAVKNTLQTLVAEVEEQMKNHSNGFKVSELYAGIAGTNIRCEVTSVCRTRPDASATIETDELKDMLAEAYKSFSSTDETVLHVIPQSYNVDDLKDLPDIEGHQGKEIQGFYIVFIGRTNSADHTKSAVEKAGYNVAKLILEPVASAKAVLTEEETELGAAIVDIGGGTSDLLIYKDDIIRYSAVIPFGGKVITSDISQICNVTERQAEMMKRRHGTCISALGPDNRFIGIRDDRGVITKRIPYRTLDEAIEARVSEIIATVMNEIRLSGYEKKISRIVITGGTANLNQIAVLFKQMTGYNIRLATPDEKVLSGNSCPEIFNPSSSTVAGLVLKGFEYEKAEEKAETETTANDEEPASIKEQEKQQERPAHHEKKLWWFWGGSRKEEPVTEPKTEPSVNPVKKSEPSEKPQSQPYIGKGKKSKKMSKDSLLMDLFAIDENDNEA